MLLRNVIRFAFRAMPGPLKNRLVPLKHIYFSLEEVRTLNAAAQEIGMKISPLLPPDKPAVFVDLGFNKGYATRAFMKALPQQVRFIGMEANTRHLSAHCERITRELSPRLTHVEMAVATTYDGKIEFHTKGRRHGLLPFVSSSVFRDFGHAAVREEPTTVKAIDFSKWLKQRFADASAKGCAVIVKMDIEGSEYDVLEKMIADGTSTLVSHMIVEFHGRCFPESEQPAMNAREANIKKTLRDSGVRVYDWI